MISLNGCNYFFRILIIVLLGLEMKTYGTYEMLWFKTKNKLHCFIYLSSLNIIEENNDILFVQGETFKVPYDTNLA